MAEKSPITQIEQNTETKKEVPEKPVKGGITVTHDEPITQDFAKKIYKDSEGKIIFEAPINSSMRSFISPDGRFLAYVEFPNIMLFDDESGKKTNLMSILDNTDGVDFYWSPSSKVVAITVVNQQDSSYRETLGTKMYLLSFNEKGELTAKDRHSIKIRFECSDSGCNVDSEDFYFENADAIVYRTWEEDRYAEKGKDSLLRKFSLK